MAKEPARPNPGKRTTKSQQQPLQAHQPWKSGEFESEILNPRMLSTKAWK